MSSFIQSAMTANLPHLNPCRGEQLFEILGDRFQRELGIATAVPVEDLDPASGDAEFQRLDQGPQAGIVVRLSLVVEHDVGVAAHQNPCPGRQIGQRLQGGNLLQALFQRGEIRRFLNQFSTPFLHALGGHKHGLSPVHSAVKIEGPKPV